MTDGKLTDYMIADNGGGSEYAPTPTHASHEGAEATCTAPLCNHWQGSTLQRPCQRVWVCRLRGLQRAEAAVAEREKGNHDRQAY